MQKIYAEGMKFFKDQVTPLIAGAKLLELVGLGTAYDKLMT